MELDALFLKCFEPFLPRPIAIMNGNSLLFDFERVIKQLFIMQNQVGGKHGLSAT